MDAQSLFGVEGLIAVITGGGSGLGLTIALALAANGASRVYILGRREPTLVAAAASCPQGTLYPIVCDITSKTSLSAAAATVKSKSGYVNLLICNAGIGAPSASLAGMPRKENGATAKDAQEFLWKQDGDAYKALSETHVEASMWTAVAFLELLEKGNESGYGLKRVKQFEGLRTPANNFEDGTRDVNIEAEGSNTSAKNASPRTTNDPPNRTQPSESAWKLAVSSTTSQILSISSAQGLNKMPLGSLAYGTSKAAQIHLSRQLSTLLEPFGIRSNVLAPGVFETALTEKYISMMMRAEGKLTRQLTPMQRSGTEEEIAGTAVWLAGRSGAYVNGTVIVLDGGRLIVNPGVI